MMLIQKLTMLNHRGCTHGCCCCCLLQEAYLKLVDELRCAEESEDDEAVFARKNTKRFRKAEQLLAPTLLQPPQQQASSSQQRPAQHKRAPTAPQPAGSSPHAVLPPEAQHRYNQHLKGTGTTPLRRQQKPPRPQQQQQPQLLTAQQQQQQSGGWQPSSEGFKGVGGLDDAKRQLREMVLMPLTYPDLYKHLGIQPPR